MIEELKHLFVLIASPAIVLGVAAYAVIRRKFLLGALASLGAFVACGLVAMKMFDDHLLFYNLIYSLLLAVPALLGITAIISGARQLLVFTSRQFRKESTSDDVL